MAVVLTSPLLLRTPALKYVVDCPLFDVLGFAMGGFNALAPI
jgi:hypothetical protein